MKVSLFSHPYSIVSLPVCHLHPGPMCFHPEESQASIDGLRESVLRYGVIQPLLVHPISLSAPCSIDTDKKHSLSGMSFRTQTAEVRLVGYSSEYEILDGVRRYRAAVDGGITEVPCQICQVEDTEVNVLQWCLQGQQIQPDRFAVADIATDLSEKTLDGGYPARLMDMDNASWKELKLLCRLSPEERVIFRQYALSIAHVKPILQLPAGTLRCGILREAAEAGLSPREIERVTEILLNRYPNVVGASTGRIRFAFREWGLFLNTLQKTITSLAQAGISATLLTDETEDGLDIRIHVPMKKE